MSIDAAKLIHGLGEGQPLSILDVGANPIEGPAPYEALLRAGLARVTGFEPNDEAHAELEAQKSEGETYHRVALGSGGRARLHLYAQSGFSSLYPIDRDVAKRLGFGRAASETGRIDIETRRLDDLDDVPLADFLKIDVQGAETQIIANGRQKLSRAMAIWTEVRFLPLYDGEPGFGSLHTELQAQGFILHDFAFLKRAALGGRTSKRAVRRRAFRQILDGDAIYIRDPAAAGVDDSQIVVLAVLAAGVLDSWELALHCLDLLRERGRVRDEDIAEFLRLVPDHLRAEMEHA